MKPISDQDNKDCSRVLWRSLFWEDIYDRLIKFPVIVGVVVIFVVATHYSDPDFGVFTIVRRLVSPTGFKGIPVQFDPPALVFLAACVFLDAVFSSFYRYFKYRKAQKDREP
jgi:hypothetical protein